MSQTRIALLAIWLLTLGAPALSKTYTLSVEAVYPANQAREVYAPLQTWLEQKTGWDIELKVENNYYFYWRSARNETPDIALDSPHIAAYRAHHKGYHLLAQTQESHSYQLIADMLPDPDQPLEQQLVGKRVIMLPNPNLSSLLFDQWFTDLFSQPIKLVTALSWGDVIEQVFDGRADAAIVPSWLAETYPNFEPLKTSPNYPGSTFTAAPHLSSEERAQLLQVLLTLGDDNESYDVLTELNSEHLIPARPDDYKGLDDVLVKLKF